MKHLLDVNLLIAAIVQTHSLHNRARGFATERKAERIPDDLPALDSHPRHSDQVTDHYLADLAAKHGFKLATLDEQLSHLSVELVR